MHLSIAFKSMIAGFLIATISLKLATGGGIRNPTFEEIRPGLHEYLVQRGFSVAGDLRIASLDGLAAMKSDCLIYLLPVAHQGWNEATIMKQTEGRQKVYFIFGDDVTQSTQSRVVPTLRYYSSKFFTYLGLRQFGYTPMIAALTTGSCDMSANIWKGVPSLPFPILSYLDPE